MYTEGSEPTEYCTTHPGNPLQPIVPTNGASTEPRPDLRDLDRNDRARERERIHSR
jgi:hypothetical protein